MKWNKPLSWIALANVTGNLLILGYFVFFYHVQEYQLTSLGQALYAFFVFAGFWVTVSLFALIFSVIHFKIWFRKELLFSTLLMLFLCTPLPIFLGNFLWNESGAPAITKRSEYYSAHDGHTTKEERYCYNDMKPAIIKYYRLDSEDHINADDRSFYKDSTWIYLTEKGDTLKTETYKRGKLLRTENH